MSESDAEGRPADAFQFLEANLRDAHVETGSHQSQGGYIVSSGNPDALDHVRIMLFGFGIDAENIDDGSIFIPNTVLHSVRNSGELVGVLSRVAGEQYVQSESRAAEADGDGPVARDSDGKTGRRRPTRRQAAALAGVSALAAGGLVAGGLAATSGSAGQQPATNGSHILAPHQVSPKPPQEQNSPVEAEVQLINSNFEVTGTRSFTGASQEVVKQIASLVAKHPYGIGQVIIGNPKQQITLDAALQFANELRITGKYSATDAQESGYEQSLPGTSGPQLTINASDMIFTDGHGHPTTTLTRSQMAAVSTLDNFFDGIDIKGISQSRGQTSPVTVSTTNYDSPRLVSHGHLDNNPGYNVLLAEVAGLPTPNQHVNARLRISNGSDTFLSENLSGPASEVAEQILQYITGTEAVNSYSTVNVHVGTEENPADFTAPLALQQAIQIAQHNSPVHLWFFPPSIDIDGYTTATLSEQNGHPTPSINQWQLNTLIYSGAGAGIGGPPPENPVWGEAYVSGLNIAVHDETGPHWAEIGATAGGGLWSESDDRILQEWLDGNQYAPYISDTILNQLNAELARTTEGANTAPTTPSPSPAGRLPTFSGSHVATITARSNAPGTGGPDR